MRRGSGSNSVALVEQRLVLLAEVPADAPATDGDVPPPVGRAQFTQVDVAGDTPPLQQHVRRAVVTVADDEILVVGRGGLQLGQSLGRGRQVGVALVELLRVDVAGRHPAAHVVQGTLEIEAERAPLLAHRIVEAPQAPAECPDQRGQVVAPHGSGGVEPGQCLGHQHRRRAQILQRHHPGHGQVGDGPDHPLGLGAQCRVGRGGVDLGEAHGATGAGEAPGGHGRPQPVGELGRPSRRDIGQFGRRGGRSLGGGGGGGHPSRVRRPAPRATVSATSGRTETWCASAVT